jgi:hypothetical protein
VTRTRATSGPTGWVGCRPRGTVSVAFLRISWSRRRGNSANLQRGRGAPCALYLG